MKLLGARVYFFPMVYSTQNFEGQNTYDVFIKKKKKAKKATKMICSLLLAMTKNYFVVMVQVSLKCKCFYVSTFNMLLFNIL